jgi:hypothetical protein
MDTASKSNLLYGIGGMVAGAAFTLTIGFSPLAGWKTRTDSNRMVESAVVSTQAAICASQFAKAPNYPERLKELKALAYGDKGPFITKGGWNKLLGDEKLSDTATQACIDRLEYATEK